MSTVKWGIMSTANIAKKAIIPALQSCGNAEVTAIASISGKAEEAANEFSIPKAYQSYEELLDDPEIQAVYIPLPNTMHKEWVTKAAEKGKHVLCEKPAALNAEDVEEMAEACRSNNVLFMEAFMYQFHTQHNRVRELIAEGTIGEVRHMRSAFTFKLDLETNKQNIRLDRGLGGGSIWDVGCYCIHSTRYILGQEPIEAYVKADVHEEFEVDTKASGLLSFEKGVTASFECGFDQPMRDYYEVSGTKGTIKVPFAYRSDRFPNGEVSIIILDEQGTEKKEVLEGNQYEIQTNHFSECILNGKKPVYSPLDTIRNIKAIQACYESLEKSAPVRL
ncbi:Gfo/Idh/MocA family oxidoreductase [Rossellomorea vietnamensis]|uniref:Gfo/Idh/MocA family oxidoreductase n=1 Tax=Rossellomorea vietnamensis TaxID=218284 RepID=A0A5D4NWA2_9BACI|nr:Gfo/Idh/MocA family oxidoreductase [Rossellomorea vietnamensis]TYS17991.1 Gfo/Idh/MocA family oxidoreductase [Rossellomorea vietnamensis]